MLCSLCVTVATKRSTASASVRCEQFKYIRNFYPQRSHLQPNVYKDNKEIVRRLRELHKQGSHNTIAGEAAVFSDTT